MKPYEQLPFTNDFGQIIEPGNRIVVVTGGRSSTVNTYEGVYLGCRTSKDWRGNPRVETVVEVKDTSYGYFDKTTGAKCHWDSPNSEHRKFDGFRQATLWCNRIFKLA